MTPPKTLFPANILLMIVLSFPFFAFKPVAVNQDHPGAITEAANPDTTVVMDGVFAIPELQITPSPSNENHLTFATGEKVVDYDVSPVGITVAAIIAQPDGKDMIKFWQIGKSEFSDSFPLPEGLIAKAITWHPNGNTLFVMGAKGSGYEICRIEKASNTWRFKTIFSTPKTLRRLLVCPRPFITSYDNKTEKEYYTYRLFFGMDNSDQSYRIVSITETGHRFYQVVGPARTFSKISDFDASADPSKMSAAWALPVAFHPAGHQLIWEDKNNSYFVARYDSKYWGDSKPMNIGTKIIGSMTPTPNGLGLVHWQKGKQGIGIFSLLSKSEVVQLPGFQFVSTPSSVPDGKGIVGLTFSNGCYTLNYLPVDLPLADVVNAWMFAGSGEELDHFQKQAGLFRPNSDDQLYKLYETENYLCNGYDRNAPTRPYIVTTDLFWELFGAAYQGLFIVRERDEAIPHFWRFIVEADGYLKKSNQKSAWLPVFEVLKEFYSENSTNPEVLRIKNEKDGLSEIIKENYAYSDLKPRGHYTSSPEMKRYFKAFRYFTTIYKNNQEAVRELNLLPDEITAIAAKWINSYTGFISPSRSPLVWNKSKQTVPPYCHSPQKEFTIFPLSWGFDNEVLYSTVYHPDAPADLQVKGPSGERMLTSGLDLATALGNGLAENLLESDYEKYPPLRKVIGNLKQNFKDNLSQSDLKGNLYNQWINAIAVQWAGSGNGLNGTKDPEIWQAKRLQTGFATWATLRHATVLVNERTAAECGEGGFEEILMRAPRGFVEPDPQTFGAIAVLFESAVNQVSKTIAGKADIQDAFSSEQRSLYDGITSRLKEAAQEARAFLAMAEKEIKGENLSNEENEKILYVARTGEHLFLVFNSLSNKDYALSNPDPMAKIADVAGDGIHSPYLMSAVGNSMEWNYIVPFYGRHQIVKGSIYSYYEFKSNQLINDEEWREKAAKQEFLPWIKPFVTGQKASGMANTCY